MSENSKSGNGVHMEGKLSRSKLLSIGVGHVIGAGVVTLCGQAVGLTGRSAWLAYGVAILLGFIMIVPYIFLSSTIVVQGGAYSIIKALSGERLAGIYIVSCIAQCMGISLTATAMGVYVNSLWGFITPQSAAIAFLIFFYIINVLGVSNMARAQRVMSIILISCLLLFIITGFTKLDTVVFNLSNSEFLTHGVRGFWDAVFLYVYSTTGYWICVNFASESKNPKKDVPWVLFAVVPIIMVIYVGVAIVASGTLPLEMVINQPLTNVAKYIMPSGLFILFMVGGPIMALLTTINSCYAGFAAPHLQAAKDGWYPESIAKCNRFGAPYIILTIILMIGLLPVLLNFDISTITRNITLVQTITTAMSAFIIWRLPKKFAKSWEKATYHVPNVLFYLIMALSMLSYVVVFIASAVNLNKAIVIVSLLVMAACVLYADWRYRSGKTKQTDSYWEE